MIRKIHGEILVNDKKKSSNENLNSINTILLELKKSIKAKDTIVFCGAGISFNSELPLVNELVRYVLEKLTVSKEEIETIINSNLPFEAFIETLRENSNVDRIFDIFDIGKPNTNHFLLAKLAKAKYLKTICTTNFDQLIEKAMESEELVRGKDFKVFYKEDDLEHIDWDDSKINLIKIHGSIEDKENMAITLHQVANKALSKQRNGVIEYIFSKGTHKNVLILGYSCSDVFDISPQIESMRKNQKKVILLDHHKDKLTVNDITDKKEKNPFQHFVGSKWVLYNTDELMKALWNFYLPEDDYISPKHSQDNPIWENFIDDWFLEIEKNYPVGAKYGIVGTIFSNISEYGISIEYNDRALRIARKSSDKQGEENALVNLGNAYNILGYYQKAIKYYEQALIIAKQIGDKQIEGACLGDLGNAYCRLGYYQKAIEFFKKGLIIAIESGNEHEAGNFLCNLGIVCDIIGYHQKAIKFQKKALSISIKIGDKQGEENIIGNLGIVYDHLKDYQEAIKYYEQGLSIAKQIGDKQGEGIWYNNLGMAYRGLKDYHKAIEFHKQALSISKEIGDKYTEGSTLKGLGNAHHSLGDYQKAIGFYEQALVILKPMLGDEHPYVKLVEKNLTVAKSQKKR